ncbi:cell cycle arrest [Homalodisca vitripennis]|nr:cell cycle arrest [Homalodisca vitripennis]
MLSLRKTAHMPINGRSPYCLLEADLSYTVSSQVPYTLQAFWGVSIRELHLFLWRPWSVIDSAARQNRLLHGHYQRIGPCIRYPHTVSSYNLS